MQFNHLKPLLIFDETCGFCNRCVSYWKLFTTSKIDYVSYQIASSWVSEEQRSDFQTAVHFIDQYGRSFKGAEAVFKLFSYTSGLKKYYIYLYQKSRFFAFIAEWVYKRVANNRSIFSFLSKLFYGDSFRPDTFLNSSILFFKGLGLVYLIAFISLLVQVKGLFLSSGLTPFSASMASHMSFFAKPSLFLFNSSDVFIMTVLWVGIGLSVGLTLGYFPLIITSFLWFIYLSFVNSGQVFMSFQWDVLLLELSFLAIFLYPYFTSHVSKFTRMSSLFHFLIKVLLFRVLFFSGLVKVLSGDSSWLSFTALQSHFYTQPLPHMMSWLAFQLPEVLKRFLSGGVLVFELFFAWLLFFPRRCRHFSVWLIGLFMITIMVTGNYGFFNILVCVLCVLFISDKSLPFLLNRFLGTQKAFYKQGDSNYRSVFIVVLGSLLLVTTVCFELQRITSFKLPNVVNTLYPFHIVNRYGLFAIMTMERLELDIQGSNDGVTWLSYKFRFKPNSVFDYPKFVLPHQPRLDWQCWFVALRPYSSSSWINVLIKDLFEGNDAVLGLFATVPFKSPPKYIRILSSNRVFSSIKDYQETGMWWIDNEINAYTPIFEFKKS